MRIKKIKITGFKSFVDTVVVPVEKNLVGVVGPNGCGKSNVIDAVRWVMGESSAKYLRGDSLTDVIFNGCSTRKPVGQASVELIFDNTHNPLVGQYANYSEIAIKRVINREAQSSYYLNGAKCRRKDLSDIFLGTGLGPRSYSIIEQGMISRVIEAKPEDLRVYIEEAAGISKYKERRRETENRIKHTRENLDRVNDIRDELGKQLEKLAHQAKVAEQYKALKEDLSKQEKYDLALNYNKYYKQYKSITEQVNDFSINLEEINSKIETKNTELEHYKIEFNNIAHSQQEEQAKYYKIEGLISSLEQEIKNLEIEKNHCQQNISNLSAQLEQCKSNLINKTAELEQTNLELGEIEPKYLEIRENKEEVRESLELSEEAYSIWEKDWQEHTEFESTNFKTISQSQAIIEKHDTLIVRSQKRISNLKQEEQELNNFNYQRDIDSLKLKAQEYNIQYQDKQQEIEDLSSSNLILENNIKELNNKLDDLNKEYQTAKGQLASLELLQENALGKDQNKINTWLKEHNLDNAKRLGEIIKVDSGWEFALEVILKEYIKAIVVSDNFDLDNLDNNYNLAFLNTNLKSGLNSDFTEAKISNSEKYSLLINKIKAPKEISLLLNNIYCADDITQAKAMLCDLDNTSSVVTKNGEWLNNNWYTKLINNSNSDTSDNINSSIVARTNKISELNNKLLELEENISELKLSIDNNKEELTIKTETRDNLQMSIRDIITSKSDINSQISKLESKQEEQRSRKYKIENELRELISHVEVDSSAVKKERAKLEESLEILEDYNSKKSTLQSKGIDLKSELKNIRSKFDNIRDLEHELELESQKLKQRSEHLENTISNLNIQESELTEELYELKQKIISFDDPVFELREKLSENIEFKQKQTEVLSIVNNNYEQQNLNMQAIEKDINLLRKDQEELRDKIQDYKIKQHELDTRIETIKENIVEHNLDLDNLISTIPDGLEISNVKNKIKNLKAEIDSLGSVNLTAIEEYEVEAERKHFLDSQEADLQEALTALEEAISQIDIETKERFRDTYDFVNEQFQYLFPKVFGGGRASLQLTSDDLLETGLTVMAQPPGKRNASIHLLSGGEKALTAIALVFSIFRMNPAPFCMLDEVDAPLDDANVARYCNLVKEMSKDVQFIFITHNKVTMTMAEHLIGVTQHEAGISRLVAVDVDEAAKMAEA